MGNVLKFFNFLLTIFLENMSSGNILLEKSQNDGATRLEPLFNSGSWVVSGFFVYVSYAYVFLPVLYWQKYRSLETTFYTIKQKINIARGFIYFVLLNAFFANNDILVFFLEFFYGQKNVCFSGEKLEEQFGPSLFTLSPAIESDGIMLGSPVPSSVAIKRI